MNRHIFEFYHGPESNMGMITAHCSNCFHEVKVTDKYCSRCGMNLQTGMIPDKLYKAGYDACKEDLIKLLKGGKKD